MRVVILTTESWNQVALCHKLSGRCEVAAVVLSQNVPRKAAPLGRRLRTLAGRASSRALGRPLLEAWQQMQAEYHERYPALPGVPLVRVTNVNDAETFEALARHRPDLVVVSGTNLVGRRLMESAPGGARFVNLHTGISPYVKGGPNCTNWCLAERAFHLIGSTVMWLDPGIDTGNIIATERAPLDGGETLQGLHWKVMEHAHDLYCRAVGRLAAGGELPSVPQRSVGEGRTFYSVEWHGGTARRALANFRRHYAPFFRDGAAAAPPAGVRLFPLGD